MKQTEQPPALKTPNGWYRWLVFFFISMAMFGNYYIYDSISPLADLLKTQLGFTDANIGLLNAIYSFPNIIMVLIGGLIIDRIGTRRSVLIFTMFVMIGAVITALRGNLALMVTGRLIFGLGAESMIVAITTIIARWFKGKELSFAFGLNLTFARLGSFLALNSPSWGRSLYVNWQKPLWITAIAGIVAVVFISIYYVLDLLAPANSTCLRRTNRRKSRFAKSFGLMPVSGTLPLFASLFIRPCSRSRPLPLNIFRKRTARPGKWAATCPAC